MEEASTCWTMFCSRCEVLVRGSVCWYPEYLYHNMGLIIWHQQNILFKVRSLQFSSFLVETVISDGNPPHTHTHTKYTPLAHFHSSSSWHTDKQANWRSRHLPKSQSLKQRLPKRWWDFAPLLDGFSCVGLQRCQGQPSWPQVRKHKQPFVNRLLNRNNF